SRAAGLKCELARVFRSGGRARCPQCAVTSMRRAGLLYAKVCAKREDFGDATGARTFLSAAAPEYSTGSKRSRALLPFDVAADRNVRAPLWFRLRRPGDRRALPAATDRETAITPQKKLLAFWRNGRKLTLRGCLSSAVSPDDPVGVNSPSYKDLLDSECP